MKKEGNNIFKDLLIKRAVFKGCLIKGFKNFGNFK